MPVKNAALWLESCIESIRKQSFTDWELIAINDHSLDESELILKQNAESDARIKVLKNEGFGIVPALQAALDQASGTFITRMDADDLMPVYRLEKMYEAAIRNPGKTVVTGLVKYFSDTEISPGYQAYEAWLNEVNLNGTQWKNIYRECIIASPNWLTARKNLIEMDGFQSLLYPEDYHLVLRWYQGEFSLVTIPEITLLWREHPVRTSRTSVHYDQDAFFKLKIREFLRHDWNREKLILWGNNVKTRLTSEILRVHKVPFMMLNFSDYQRTVQHEGSQVLIGVYPPADERRSIVTYLNKNGWQEGMNFWFL